MLDPLKAGMHDALPHPVLSLSLCRFENLALQYDSDEIGELEEDDERIQNEDLFPAHDRLLQQLMARHREDDPAENSLPYEAAADVRNQEGEEGAEAAAAIFKVMLFAVLCGVLQASSADRSRVASAASFAGG